MRLERRLQRGALTIDEDVDVVAEHRPWLAQPVAEPGPPLVEARDCLVHARRIDIQAPRQAMEQWRQRGGQVKVGHGYARTATSTEEIAGR